MTRWSELSNAQRKAMLLFDWTLNKYRYNDNVLPYASPFLYADCRFTRESAPDNTLSSLWKKGLVVRLHEDVCGDYYALSEEGAVLLISLFWEEDTRYEEFDEYFEHDLGIGEDDVWGA